MGICLAKKGICRIGLICRPQDLEGAVILAVSARFVLHTQQPNHP